MFTTIIIYYEVTNPKAFWESTKLLITEDIQQLHKKKHANKDIYLSNEQKDCYALIEVENFLKSIGISLNDIQGMPLPNPNVLTRLNNKYLNEESLYDSAT